MSWKPEPITETVARDPSIITAGSTEATTIGDSYSKERVLDGTCCPSAKTTMCTNPTPWPGETHRRALLETTRPLTLMAPKPHPYDPGPNPSPSTFTPVPPWAGPLDGRTRSISTQACTSKSSTPAARPLPSSDTSTRKPPALRAGTRQSSIPEWTNDARTDKKLNRHTIPSPRRKLTP